MGFFRQEYWRGLPCPPPGDLPDPGIKLTSPVLQAVSLPAEPSEKALIHIKTVDSAWQELSGGGLTAPG